jgi:hypothetical protein
MERHASLEAWLCRDGTVLQYQKTHNLILDSAKGLLADLMRGHPLSSVLRAVAIGSDGTTPDIGDAGLLSEVTRLPLPVADIDTATERNVLVAGVTASIYQTFGPGLVATIREVGLAGDIVEIADPTAAPVLAESASGGFLESGTYTVGYSWSNNNGETLLSPTDSIVVTGPTGEITVTLPTLPSTAVTANVYAALDPNPVLLSGSEAGTSYVFGTVPTGQAEPGANTTLIPGIIGSGRFLNRGVFGPFGLTGTETLTIKSEPSFS